MRSDPRVHTKIKGLSLSHTQIVVVSFLFIIIIGAVLLSLPISSRTGEWTSFFDSFFTSASVTCVTGLMLYDTYTHWSMFGQTVILVLMQIGGLSVMTIVSLISLIVGRRITLGERRMLMQSAGTLKRSGVFDLVKNILKVTALCEGIGAAVLFIRFYPEFGLVKGVFYAVFHAVSAFCNAGIDIMGYRGQFGSFITFGTDVFINITIMALIIIGGLGFFVWEDIIKAKFRIKHMHLHSKLAISVSFILIVVGAIGFFIFERNHAFANLGPGHTIMASLFQSVSSRTTGFATVDQAAFSDSGTMLTTILMFIGGSPGSTAGGIKTTTFAIIVANAIAGARNRGNIVLFKRRISDYTIKLASSIFSIYLLLTVTMTMIVSALESMSFGTVLFEVVSALSTTGFSHGPIGGYKLPTLIIYIVLMYIGRVGALAFVLAFAERRESDMLMRPKGKVLIG